MRGSSIFTRHTLLCTALISLLNNPLESTLLRSQNITASTTTSAKIPHQIQMIEHTPQCMMIWEIIYTEQNKLYNIRNMTKKTSE